ncbi:MAG: NAD(P)H-dependent oxidoreductase subunit E [Clostridiales bacterium]|nr:NAD(P)H-dependent oxidoreductase subunit E [Clostridiales bacterium]
MNKENLLDTLLARQNASKEGYLDREAIAAVAEEFAMPETRVFEIASYYAMLEIEPQAKYVLEICNSTPCYFSKSNEVAAWVEGELDVKPGDVTGDGLFSWHYTPCVGACDIGPVIKVRDTVYGDLTKETVHALIQDLRNAKNGKKFR